MSFQNRNIRLIIIGKFPVSAIGNTRSFAIIPQETFCRIGYLAISFVAYGFFLRTLLVLHATWMVNSLAHRWGYKNYPTSDESRNNAIVGLLAQGEGWHNNHHHCQNSVNHGHRWWEIDFTFLVIYFLAIFSWPLAWVGWGQHRPVCHLKYFSHRQQKIKTLFPERT